MSNLASLIGPALTRTRSPALAFALGLAVAAAPSFAVTYTEGGDAGQTPGTAQLTGTPGTVLDAIAGTLGSATDADLFVLRIVSPTTFSATTVGGSQLDTQLFLFTLAGAPVYMNDDANGLSLQSTLPTGNAFGPVAAGTYLLGVALAGYDPVNLNSQLLFAGGLSTDVRGPASLLQPAALSGFVDNTFFADSGAYTIQLTGVAAAIPEPAPALLLLAGAAALGLRAARARKRALAA